MNYHIKGRAVLDCPYKEFTVNTVVPTVVFTDGSYDKGLNTLHTLQKAREFIDDLILYTISGWPPVCIKNIKLEIIGEDNDSIDAG